MSNTSKETTSSKKKLIRFQSITKRFTGVVALHDVTFGISVGSCHALIGENGAGKSTLGKILCGIYQPDAGNITLDGEIKHFHSPLDAHKAGIGVVHQELAYCSNLSVAENLFLSSLPRRGLFVHNSELRKRSRELLEEIGAYCDVDEELGNLSTGQIQLVQIAAALSNGARVIVMDEPTSSLSISDTERLYQIIEELQSKGTTIIYISHRMEEIFHLCDTVTVLRDGQHVQTKPLSQTNEEELIHSMIGRSLSKYFPGHTQIVPGPQFLRVEKLCSHGKFYDINFFVRSGEVLGIAGLVGSGRSEIALSLFGLDPNLEGNLHINDHLVSISSPLQAMTLGIGLVPEDRKRQGLVLSMNAGHNISLPSLRNIKLFNFISAKKESSIVSEYFNRLSIQPANPDTEMASFSGGNQQKVILAKWLARKCNLIIFDEPTRGVDIGAKAEIHSLIDELACNGKAVILISSEMSEILNLSTRIMVLRQGIFVGEVNREYATQETIMQLMAGITTGEADA